MSRSLLNSTQKELVQILLDVNARDTSKGSEWLASILSVDDEDLPVLNAELKMYLNEKVLRGVSQQTLDDFGTVNPKFASWYKQLIDQKYKVVIDDDNDDDGEEEEDEEELQTRIESDKYDIAVPAMMEVFLKTLEATIDPSTAPEPENDDDKVSFWEKQATTYAYDIIETILNHDLMYKREDMLLLSEFWDLRETLIEELGPLTVENVDQYANTFLVEYVRNRPSNGYTIKNLDMGFDEEDEDKEIQLQLMQSFYEWFDKRFNEETEPTETFEYNLFVEMKKEQQEWLRIAFGSDPDVKDKVLKKQIRYADIKKNVARSGNEDLDRFIQGFVESFENSSVDDDEDVVASDLENDVEKKKKKSKAKRKSETYDDDDDDFESDDLESEEEEEEDVFVDMEEYNRMKKAYKELQLKYEKVLARNKDLERNQASPKNVPANPFKNLAALASKRLRTTDSEETIVDENEYKRHKTSALLRESIYKGDMTNFKRHLTSLNVNHIDTSGYSNLEHVMLSNRLKQGDRLAMTKALLRHGAIVHDSVHTSARVRRSASYRRGYRAGYSSGRRARFRGNY